VSVENFLAGVRPVGDDGQGNVLVPSLRDCSFPNGVRGDAGGTLRGVVPVTRRFALLDFSVVWAFPRVEARPRHPIHVVGDGGGSHSPVFRCDEGVASFIVGDIVAVRLDVVLNHVTGLVVKQEGAFPFDALLDWCVFVGAMLDVYLASVVVEVFNVDGSETASTEHPFPEQQEHRVHMRGVVELLQIREECLGFVGFDANVPDVLAFVECGGVHVGREVRGDRHIPFTPADEHSKGV